MTDIRTSPTGQNVSSLAIVSADQDTVIGDGTASNPLRSSVESASGDFTATQIVTSPVLGDVVRSATISGDVVVAFAADGGNRSAAAAAGLVVQLLGGSSVLVRFRGQVTLTDDQWDVVTGDTGGLVTAAVYYVSDDPGKLSQTPGTAWVAQVGVAISSTTLLVGLPAAPLSNL